MRLRVLVQRHELPPTRLLWNVRDPDQTISQLLEQVNDLIPIESDGWGLEDYAVQLGAFEALHFIKVGDILKDEDEITVRPLATNDIRARNLTGRHQIDNGGRHLIDGVAFGRPLLRHPSRPPIHIPPRRAAAIADCAQSDLDDLSEQLLQIQDLRTSPTSVGPLPYNVESGFQSVPTDGDADSQQPVQLRGKEEAWPESSNRKRKRVSFGVLDTNVESLSDLEDERLSESDDSFDPSDAEDDSEEEDDEESGLLDEDVTSPEETPTEGENSRKETSSGQSTPAPSTMALVRTEGSSDSPDTSDASSMSSSSEGSTSNDSSSESSGDGDASNEAPREAFTNGHVTPVPSKRTSALSNGSLQPTKRGQGEETLPPRKRTKTSHTPQAPQSAPYQGLSRTKARNMRKTETKKLRWLKSTGALASNATKDDLRQLLGGQDRGRNEPTSTVDKSPSEPMNPIAEQEESSSVEEDSSDDDSSVATSSSAPSEEEISHTNKAHPELLPAVNGSRKSVQPEINGATDSPMTDEFQKRRQALLAAISSGGVEVTVSGDLVQSDASIPDANPVVGSSQTDASSKQSRRARLDVAGSRRMLMGSLGLRAPKNDAEREKLQQKLAAQVKRKPVPPPVKDAEPVQTVNQSAENEPMEEDNHEESDFWRSRINLSAVECCDGDVFLSTPPFPFYQRWDPSQWLSKKRKRNSSTYNAPNGTKSARQTDSYFVDGASDALNYDDGDEDVYGAADEGAHEDADAAEQLQQELAEDDDLPPLPEDINTLPPVKNNEIAKGDIIVFSRLEVSVATNWQPAQSPLRTAMVEYVNEDGGGDVELRLAARDLPERTYDQDGNRVYRKFETRYDDDDDEAEALVSVNLADLSVARLLQKGSTVDGPQGGEGD